MNVMDSISISHVIYFRTGGELKPSFFTIKVFDDDLRDLVRDEVKKGTNIRLEGKLLAHKEADNEGKQRHASFIRASNVMIIASRAETAQSANDNTADEFSTETLDGQETTDSRISAGEQTLYKE